MGFFDSKKPEPSAKPMAPVASPVVKSTNTGSGQTTKISPQFRFEGKSISDDDIHIEGFVSGEIECRKNVVVGTQGRVEATIRCHSITIQGTVRGNIEASHTVTIEASGKLYGDIRTQIFVNQPGGFFEGYSHMLANKDNALASNEDKNKKK